MKTKYIDQNLFSTPILISLVENNGQATVDMVAKTVWDLVSDELTYNDINTILSGETAFRNRMRWQGNKLKKLGLMKSEKRGVWQITKNGRELLRTFTGVV